jgi:hypothetical protein
MLYCGQCGKYTRHFMLGHTVGPMRDIYECVCGERRQWGAQGLGPLLASMKDGGTE